MPRENHCITQADILPLTIWGEQRAQHRRALSHVKAGRRIAIGPHATLYFENWDTMWYQVQEMLWIEKGGAAQLADELEAYNPLVPNGRELTATLMFEIPDPRQRAVILGQLGGVEQRLSLSVGADRIAADTSDDLDRTTADGKTSAVHFVHFAFTPAQIAAFADPDTEVMVRIDHPAYGHAAIIGAAMRAELAADFD